MNDDPLTGIKHYLMGQLDAYRHVVEMFQENGLNRDDILEKTISMHIDRQRLNALIFRIESKAEENLEKHSQV